MDATCSHNIVSLLSPRPGVSMVTAGGTLHSEAISTLPGEAPEQNFTPKLSCLEVMGHEVRHLIIHQVHWPRDTD